MIKNAKTKEKVPMKVCPDMFSFTSVCVCVCVCVNNANNSQLNKLLKRCEGVKVRSHMFPKTHFCSE